MRGIDHRAYVINGLRNLREILADTQVVVDHRCVSEDIRRLAAAKRDEAIPTDLQELLDSGLTIRRGYRPTEIRPGHIAICGEADVIVLHFVEPERDYFLCQADIGIPHLALKRIHPGGTVLV